MSLNRASRRTRAPAARDGLGAAVRFWTAFAPWLMTLALIAASVV